MKIYVFYNTAPHPWQFGANWQFTVSIERLEVGELCHLLRLGDVIAVGEQVARAVERLCKRKANAVTRDVAIRGGDVAVSIYAIRDPAVHAPRGGDYGVAPIAVYKYALKVDIAE